MFHSTQIHFLELQNNKLLNKMHKKLTLILILILILKKTHHFRKVSCWRHSKEQTNNFLNRKELEDPISKENLVHRFLPKHTDINKILEVIQRKVLKGTHLPVEIKEIQAGHLHSPYFKDLYLYLLQNKLPSSKSAIRKLGIQQYATNALLFLGIIQDKYISLYRELITQLHTYVSAIRILAKGYLPNTLITPKKLQEILSEVKRSLRVANPDYTLGFDRLHLYYDMQLVTFGIDSDMNLVIQFLVFIQPYTKKPLILYQLEMVPVPVLDQNTKAQSYTHSRIKKPYIALNSETYISLRQQELRSCKKIGYEFYCEELFVVKHKSSYSCAIFFNLTTDITKNNCDFDIHFNNTYVTPTVLDGGDEIVVANWPNDKNIIGNINNDIPIKIPSHPYVLVNRSILGNCRIEADNHHLLESIAACDNKITKSVMYFTINLTFTNYLDMLPNMTDSLPLIKDRTRYEQPLPLNLGIPYFHNSLRHRPRKLRLHDQLYQ